MTHYLLTNQQPDGPPPASVDLATIARNVHRLENEMKDAGVWVFSGHLHPPTTATVVRLEDGDVRTTDGPYAEGNEHIGGLSIITCPIWMPPWCGHAGSHRQLGSPSRYGRSRTPSAA